MYFLEVLLVKAVVVYTTYNDLETEIIKNLLKENGIPYQIISNITHSI
ncbi:DUF2007 domain-containing protein, partial [bacterium]|nr:DUF2007 domain-containing protein [bacterium]